MQFQPPRLSTAVKYLLIAMGVGFVAQLSLHQFVGLSPIDLFAFSPEGFFSGRIWQPFTYAFLHADLTHLGFNALMLYMAGPQLEFRWGTQKFLKYFVVSATGGVFLHTLVWLVGHLFLSPSALMQLGAVPILGSSGAAYGLLAAFAVLYGESQFLVFLMFPMKVRHFVFVLTAVAVVSAVFYTSSGVAHLVHLGGLASGYLYLKFWGPNLDGRGGRGGGGGFFRRRKAMDREEVRRRLNLVVNKDAAPGNDKKYPITWN